MLWGAESFWNITNCANMSDWKSCYLRMSEYAFQLGNIYNIFPSLPNISLLWLMIAFPEALHDNHLVEFASNHFLGFYCHSRFFSSCFGWMFSKLVSILITKRMLNSAVHRLNKIKEGLCDLSQKLPAQGVVEELKFSTNLLIFCSNVWFARKKVGLQRPLHQIENRDKEKLLPALVSLIEQHKSIWLATSRSGGGLDDSVSKLERLRTELQQ